MAAGVEGVLVRVYTCSHCQKDDVFLDVCPMPGESNEAVRKRKRELESVVRQIPKGDADVVLAERLAHPPKA